MSEAGHDSELVDVASTTTIGAICVGHAESATSIAALNSALPKLSPAKIAATKPMASKAPAPVAAAPASFAPDAGAAVDASATPASARGVSEPEKPPQKTMEIAMTTTEDFMTQGQANVEAVIKSGQIWATGVQDLQRTFAESAQAQFEHNLATWKALVGIKSMKEAFDLQSARARVALEKAVADTGKLTDASMKLAEQTIAPIAARLSVTSDRFVRPN